MQSLFLLGLLLGMRHALEADHLAAVSTLATKEAGASPRRLAFLGASWGLGHTTTLFLLSVPALVFGHMLSDNQMAKVEIGMGLILVILGADVLRQLVRRKIHLHAHTHEDGVRHIHFHAHAPEDEGEDHVHRHGRFSGRAYLVGLIHGIAGSSALIALTAAAAPTLLSAWIYILLFGLGSMIGMAILTVAVAVPMRLADSFAERVGQGIRLLAGGTSIGFGLFIIFEEALPKLLGA